MSVLAVMLVLFVVGMAVLAAAFVLAARWLDRRRSELVTALHDEINDVGVLARAAAAAIELAPGEADEPSRIVRGLFREEIVATLKTGETFKGVLVAADAHALVLREAHQLAERGSVPVDGELLLPRADIRYLQRP